MDTAYIFVLELLVFALLAVCIFQQSRVYTLLSERVDEQEEVDSSLPQYPYKGTRISVRVKGVGLLYNEGSEHERYYEIEMNGCFPCTFHLDELKQLALVSVYRTREQAESMHEELPLAEGIEYRDTYGILCSVRGVECAYEIDTPHEAERLSYFMSTGVVLQPEWEW